MAYIRHIIGLIEVQWLRQEAEVGRGEVQEVWGLKFCPTAGSMG